MTMTRIEGIDFELEADGVSIKQHDGCGNPVDSIYLHKVLVAHLAAEMGLLKPDAPANLQAACLLERENATLRRRMRTLHRKIAELDAFLWSVPVFPPSDNVSEDCQMSSALLELCDEFMQDLGVMSSNTPEPVAPRHETQPEPTGYPEGTQRKAKGSLQLELESA
jgi:hypothetical protein